MKPHPKDKDPRYPDQWQHWYDSRAWRRRSLRQRQQFPLCQICEANGLTIAATDADHIKPFRGSWLSFILGEIQSLCHACHRQKQNAELHGHKPKPDPGFSRAIGLDGFPLDQRHPVYKVK